MFKTLALIALASSATVVTACEGECIVGITNAFLSNYTAPINSALENLNGQLVAEFTPGRRYASFLRPVLEAYRQEAYDRLETSIFPSYFHGKCQVPDPDFPDAPPTNPPGCPNPDCPVVCGTPGSLVHFYSILRFIVFNETSNHLQTIATPGTKPYQAVEKKILREMEKHPNPRAIRTNTAGTRAPRQQRLVQEDIKERLQQIMSTLHPTLEESCGGKATDDIDALPQCSWEEEMKTFILTYP